MLVFHEATPAQRTAASTLCSLFVDWIPQRPSSVQVAAEGPYSLMLIRFREREITLVASFYASGSRCSQELQLAELQLRFQPLKSTFRAASHRISYEELGTVLRGTPVRALQGPALHSYMRGEMSNAMTAYLNNCNAEPPATAAA